MVVKKKKITHPNEKENAQNVLSFVCFPDVSEDKTLFLIQIAPLLNLRCLFLSGMG